MHFVHFHMTDQLRQKRGIDQLNSMTRKARRNKALDAKLCTTIVKPVMEVHSLLPKSMLNREHSNWATETYIWCRRLAGEVSTLETYRDID